MNRLPSYILSKEIIPNLSCEDQISFAMSNVMLSNLFLKQTRSIHIPAHRRNLRFKADLVENRLQLYVTSQEFRDKVHGLVQDSYYQLKLIIPDDLPYDITGLDNITCNQLETTASMLMNSLCHRVKKVRSLRFRENGYMGHLPLSLMQSIAQWINDNNSSLALRELGFSNYDFSDLPVILNLQSLILRCCSTIQVSGLHLTGYDKLRHLTLASCESVRDVSSLDGIHELYLIDCVGIRDVSCLNHNYKIVVEQCPNIVDYFNCFRYSKIIYISCFARKRKTINIDLSASLEAIEIELSGGLSSLKKRLILPNCLSLIRVYVENFSSPFTLPAENKIQAVTIQNCSGFSSQLNFHLIHQVKLHTLKITNLEGLSSGNRIVEISRCHLINDFSVLRQCDKVVIDSCKGFRDISQVRGVRDFTYCADDIENLPSDLEGVTCLWLRAVPSDLFSFAFPSSLEKLVLLENSHFNQQILSLLAVWPPHIRKVEVLSYSCGFINEFQSMLKAEKVLPYNVLEFKKGIHFFR